MKHDEKNVIIDNVLSESEIEEIYSSLSGSYRKYVMGLYMQQISDFTMPEHIKNKIVNYVEEITGLVGFEIDYQFSRYELMEDAGPNKPNLTPHFDGFPEPRFTFDYQIRSNIDWPLYVEGKEFVLKDNQALTFSGTHQVHWRSHHDFKPGEFVDMVFCHLYLANSEMVPNSHFTDMKKRVASWEAALK